MAQQSINLGSQANDGTGDSIRDAFDKVNTNFTEIYTDLTLFNSVFSTGTDALSAAIATVYSVTATMANFSATQALFQQDLNDVANTLANKIESVTPAAGTGIGITNIDNTPPGIGFTIINTGVQTLTAGTDTRVSSSTGTVTIWNASTLQTVTDRGTTTTNEIVISSSNAHGGTGYAGLLTFKNSIGGSTNPNKFIRLNSTGDLQIVNSAYTSTIFALTDTGQLTLKEQLHLDKTVPSGGGFPDASYTYGPTTLYTGGETKFGKWRQYHNSEEWSYALVYNTAVNPHTVFPATYAARDTTDSTADIVFANRIDVAEGHSGQNFWGAEWAPANDTVPATQPDWAAGSAMRYYDGGVLALANSWGNSAQWSSSGDPKSQPSGTFRDSAIQLISGETVAGPHNQGYSHVMRTSATDGSFKIQDVTEFKNSSTYWIPITPPSQVGIVDRLVIDTNGTVTIASGNLAMPLGKNINLFNSSGGYYSYINGGTSTNASIVFGNSQIAIDVMKLSYQGNLTLNGVVQKKTQRYTAGNGTCTVNPSVEVLFIDCTATSLTIVFPPTPVDGQSFTITSWYNNGSPGTITCSAPGTNLGSPITTIIPTTPASWCFLNETSSWFRTT